MVVLTTVTSEGACLKDETEDWLYASDGSQDAVWKVRSYLQSTKPVEQPSTSHCAWPRFVAEESVCRVIIDGDLLSAVWFLGLLYFREAVPPLGAVSVRDSVAPAHCLLSVCRCVLTKGF